MAGLYDKLWVRLAREVSLVLFLLLYPLAAHAVSNSAAQVGANAAAFNAPDGDDDESEVDPQPAQRGPGAQRQYRPHPAEAPLGGLLTYASPLLMALAYFYFTSRDSRSSGVGGGWGSYYLFWLVGPALLAIFLAHPAFLVIVVVGVLARPWLPDPFLWLRYWGRVRRLQGDIRVNRANVTARRDLAIIWLEKRRPKRALPLLEEALAQDPKSLQLQHLRGICLLGLDRYQEAVDAFVAVVQEDPGHAFGDPYLRAADALIALKRWDDAEDALEHFVDKNRSSVEGQYKRALVARGRGDRPAFKQALREARDVYREVPRYQQRRQVAWYIRALFSTVLG